MLESFGTVIGPVRVTSSPQHPGTKLLVPPFFADERRIIRHSQIRVWSLSSLGSQKWPAVATVKLHEAATAVTFSAEDSDGRYAKIPHDGCSCSDLKYRVDSFHYTDVEWL